MNSIKGHQGDIIFSTIKEIPANAVKVKNKPVAYGEFSGHCHVITGDVELFEFDGKVFAAVGSDGGRLQHVHETNLTDKCWTSTEEIAIADHKSHLLPPGNYQIWIQNSYNPYSKLMEKVVD